MVPLGSLWPGAVDVSEILAPLEGFLTSELQPILSGLTPGPLTVVDAAMPGDDPSHPPTTPRASMAQWAGYDPGMYAFRGPAFAIVSRPDADNLEVAGLKAHVVTTLNVTMHDGPSYGMSHTARGVQQFTAGDPDAPWQAVTPAAEPVFLGILDTDPGIGYPTGSGYLDRTGQGWKLTEHNGVKRWAETNRLQVPMPPGILNVYPDVDAAVNDPTMTDRSVALIGTPPRVALYVHPGYTLDVGSFDQGVMHLAAEAAALKATAAELDRRLTDAENTISTPAQLDLHLTGTGLDRRVRKLEAAAAP